jgi:hypothetical protein
MLLKWFGAGAACQIGYIFGFRLKLGKGEHGMPNLQAWPKACAATIKDNG